MGIINIFRKKKPFPQDPQSPIPPSQETLVKKATPRGTGGKFISKRELEKIPVSKTTKTAKPAKPTKAEETKTYGPYPITFYGHEVKRYRHNDKWFFALNDVIAIAQTANPLDENSRVKLKKGFAKTKEEVVISLNQVECVDAEGALKVSEFIIGVFPGPFSVWLQETARFPFKEADFLPITVNGELPKSQSV